MQKEQLLSLVSEYVGKGILTWNDLSAAYKRGSLSAEGSNSEKRMGVADVLYYIGGFIICIGIALLVSQNWDTLSSSVKILVTLGTAIAFYVSALLINKEGKNDRLSAALHFIAAALFSIGVPITFNTLGYPIQTSGWAAFISGLLALFYVASAVRFKRTVFVIFSVFFGTVFSYAMLGFVLSDRFYEGDAYYYLTLGLGASYVFFARHFLKGRYVLISKYLDAVGAFGILLSTFLLGGFDTDKNIFWETVYPAVVFGALFMSVYLRVRSFLVLGSVFLMAYIIKITSEYFYASLGWAFSLVVAGFFLIVVGALTVYLNRRFLSEKSLAA